MPTKNGYKLAMIMIYMILVKAMIESSYKDKDIKSRAPIEVQKTSIFNSLTYQVNQKFIQL